MSLEDLINLNKRVFGSAEPMIQLFKSSYGTYQDLIGSYENLFLYTGCRSILVIDGVVNTTYVHFENYICFADISSALGAGFTIRGLFCPTHLYPAYGFHDNGHGYQIYELTIPTNNTMCEQRGYLLRYANTKTLKQ